MTEYLAHLCGGLLPAMLAAFAFAAGFAGTGYGFLRVCGLGRGMMRGLTLWLVSLAAGFAVCAFFCAAVLMSLGTGTFPCLVCLFPVLAGIGCLIRFRKEVFSSFSVQKRMPFAVLIALVPLLFLSIGAFQYPASWDECVYQLAVPQRWLADGRVLLYRDLPYSGFPMLPQFLYVPMMKFAGLASVKFLLYGGAACFFASLTMLACGSIRRNLTGACVFAGSFLIAPLTVHVMISGYVEPLMGSILAAGLLLADAALKAPGKRADAPGFAVACGILAGAMAAFKLTGGVAGAAFLLYALLRKRGGHVRFALTAALAGALFALLFYQRPWIATGNPCYPYLGGVFGAPDAMTSEFHHLLGTAKFANRSIVTVILLLPGLTFPVLSRMFDGVYGLQMLLWAFLALVVLWRRPKHICAALLPLAFLVGSWMLTSPQARFLIPALPFLALIVRDAFPIVRGRAGRIVLWAAVAFSLFSFPPSVFSSYGANLRATFSGGDGRRDVLYGRTGDSMLPAVYLLNEQLANGGKCLLVLEERTLYFPRGCEIGTPFFQDKYFPGGKIPDADSLLKLLDDGGFTCLYVRPPEHNPDYLPQAAAFWTDDMRTALDALVKRGDLASETMPGGAELYTRVRR
ncbi:MAG: hypothetical protein J6Y92_07155 [Lentisphaeria bacterium]|nr:hypothetical protein [Lentisphaeria bacterium]